MEILSCRIAYIEIDRMMERWKMMGNWYDIYWYFLYGNSFAYMEKWVVTHFRKNNVKLTSIFYKKKVRLLQYSQNQSSTIVNIIQFSVYIMLLMYRLMGVILLKIDSIFWYFAGQSLHSHTIFQLTQLTQETISSHLSSQLHSSPLPYSPHNPLIPTILPFSAIILPYLYSKLSYPI